MASAIGVLVAGIKIVKGLNEQARTACSQLDKIGEGADTAIALAKKVSTIIKNVCGKYDKMKPVIEKALTLPLPFKPLLYRIKSVIEAGCSHNAEFLSKLSSPEVQQSKQAVMSVVKQACAINDQIYNFIAKIPLVNKL